MNAKPDNTKNRFIKTERGWIEQISTEIIVDHVPDQPLCGFPAWEKTSQSIHRKSYRHCSRCKKAYEPADNVFMAFTSAGNKHICGHCANEVRGAK